jgi:hypothetical protein
MSKKQPNRFSLNEGLYDFYELYDPSPNYHTIDKIQNYYLDKIKKFGKESLTKREMEIFKDATMGKLKSENPVYKKDKVTGDIELDAKGQPIRLDKEIIQVGVPFVTSKGRGISKETVRTSVNGRCYWDVDDNIKVFYVYGGEITETNPEGLIIWKSVSKSGKPMGSFIIPKGEALMSMENLWKNLNGKYDKGIILDKETYGKFLTFDELYHSGKVANIEQLQILYNYLRKYPQK